MVLVGAAALASRRDLSPHRGTELDSFAERSDSDAQVSQNEAKISMKHLLELNDAVDEDL
jgi:hypothetical protein